MSQVVVYESCDWCPLPNFSEYGDDGDIWVCPLCHVKWEVRQNWDLKLPWGKRRQMYWKRVI